jgi:UDP-N-acetylglucosamine--N-acetylmuramyl-(pentapeptide) pyrophosphoryl-undecaprenol N-acetylglucosamine transferase
LKRILIMAGGTGGHVIPALTVAQHLKSQGIDVHWLGTRGRLEEQLVPAAHIPITYLNISTLRGKRLKQLFTFPLALVLACYQALKAINQLQPDVVLGMGGFAAGPGGVAAWLLGKPLIIHEQNAVAGLTNRILAYFAKPVLTAIPQAFAAKYRALMVGNPVRQEILGIPSPEERLHNRQGPLRVLILGGSQGASALNQRLPPILAALSSKVQVRHQSGAQQAQAVTQAYHQLNFQEVQVSAFIEDMAAAYAWADLVICRAGALTIAELCAAGVASILIPYPYATDDHQTLNAKFLVDAGAAILIQQTHLNADNLLPLLNDLAQNPQQLLTMALAARRLCVRSAAQEISEHCMSFFKV